MIDLICYDIAMSGAFCASRRSCRVDIRRGLLSALRRSAAVRIGGGRARLEGLAALARRRFWAAAGYNNKLSYSDKMII